MSRHSQDKYNEKLTQQYFHFWDLDLCRVKSDPWSRDLAVSLHKELTVPHSESWSQGDEESLSVHVLFRKHSTIKVVPCPCRRWWVVVVVVVFQYLAKILLMGEKCWILVAQHFIKTRFYLLSTVCGAPQFWFAPHNIGTRRDNI